jgi:cytochrome c553
VLLRAVVGIALAISVGNAKAADAESTDTQIQFNRDIRPILGGHCFKCHGPAEQEAGLRLDSADVAAALLPSESRAIVPGDAAASALLKRVTSEDADERMPPPDAGPPLSTAQIALLRQWIAEGAEYQKHWAYLPPVRPVAPVVQNTAWPRNEIDNFVLSRMEAAGLSPAAEASRETLLRRVSLDLVGLPPTPDEVRAFIDDTSPDAYERVVDRLLASPQYGVRQALAWLDLARYADTQGYPNDGDRTIWPYRDWVVNALNADMPLDQFTIEQLAGDLLPGATIEQQIASGFHRQTRINQEAGVDPEEFRIEAVIDRANTTASVWLGATLGCAQCHDHKFDPYPQRDYYRLLAYFNNGAVETESSPAGEIKDISPRIEVEMLASGAASSTKVTTLVMRDIEPPRPTHIFLRGSFLTLGEQVSPGTPTVFDSLPPAEGSDRLALARWLVDKRNPLTARVAVNRLWAQYFGAGLVETLDDLGTQSAPLTHPELLDWLATELMRRDWHFKPLHRLVVASATYRQAALANAAAAECDPANRLLSHSPRLRLSAELVRDNALAAAGILSTELAGPSIPAFKMVASPAAGSGNSPYRRSIYVRWRRLALDDTFANFDAPTRDVSCTRRTRTNTPLQALTLLNDRVFFDAARGLAARAQRDGGHSLDEQIDYAFRIVLARAPADAERQTLSGLFERRRSALASDLPAARELLGEAAKDVASDDELPSHAAWVLVANALLNLNEAITRE